jgi:hypothetical protein
MIRTLALLTVSSLLFGITFATGQDTSDPLQTNSVWANEKDKKMVLTITERKGESFKALFSNREVNGKIEGQSIFWLSKDVRALGKNGVGGDNYGILKKDDLGFKIDFTWQNKPTGPKGSFTLRQVVNNNVATNVPNTKNAPSNLKEIKEDMKPKTGTTIKTIEAGKDLSNKKEVIKIENKNEKDLLPDSQKLFLEKLIEIRKSAGANQKTNLNPIVQKEEQIKIIKQDQELEKIFKVILIEGQIKNWQGKIIVQADRFQILIGDLSDIFQSKEEKEKRRKDYEKDLKSNITVKKGTESISPLIRIFILIDSGLDKSSLESLKKLSDYDSIEFSIKKFPPALIKDLTIVWPQGNYAQHSDVTINSKCLESLIHVSK